MYKYDKKSGKFSKVETEKTKQGSANADLEARISELETEIAVISGNNVLLETEIAAKDAKIAELEAAVAKATKEQEDAKKAAK